MDKYCHHCEMTDTDLQEGKTERGNCYRDFPATNGTIDVWYGKPACLKFQPTRSWLAYQVQELEAQLAAKDKSIASLAEVCRVTEEHYDEYVAELKQELAEVNEAARKAEYEVALAEDLRRVFGLADDADVGVILHAAYDRDSKARLQVALDRIEAAGYEGDYAVMPESGRYSVYLDGDLRGKGATAADAAEAAAAWCEGQKEG
jgi:hypothetical protein